MAKDKEPKASAENRKVRAPEHAGVVAYGPHRPGGVYTVPAAEAERLIRCKGYTAAD